jgi:hypothetical protein
MNKIKRSLRLLKAALAVMARERKLLFFPMIASGLAILAALFFLLPVVAYPTGHPFFSAAHWQTLAATVAPHGEATKYHLVTQGLQAGQPGMVASPFQSRWVRLWFVPVYLSSMFIATFANAAFYHEILQALNGKRVSIRRGFRCAASRWRAILLWSLFAGLVGYIIRAIEQRVGLLGKIVTGFIGTGWSVACIFVIPTLVRDPETTNPVKLLRRSAGTLKRTWGELVIGFAGVELATGLVAAALVLSAVAFFSLAGHAGGAHSLLRAISVVAGLALFLSIFLALSWLSRAVNSIYRCALYIYATEGVVPGSFDQELLDSAWKVN